MSRCSKVTLDDLCRLFCSSENHEVSGLTRNLSYKVHMSEKKSSAKLSLTWPEWFLLPPRLRWNRGNQSSGGLKKKTTHTPTRPAPEVRKQQTRKLTHVFGEVVALAVQIIPAGQREREKESERRGEGKKRLLEKHTGRFWAESRERLSRSEVDP